MLIMIICLVVFSVINMLISIGTARNVSRLMDHEIDKMEQDSKLWHSTNVTYKDSFLANREKPSDGLNITHLS